MKITCHNCGAVIATKFSELYSLDQCPECGAGRRGWTAIKRQIKEMWSTGGAGIKAALLFSVVFFGFGLVNLFGGLVEFPVSGSQAEAGGFPSKAAYAAMKDFGESFEEAIANVPVTPETLNKCMKGEVSYDIFCRNEQTFLYAFVSDYSSDGVEMRVVDSCESGQSLNSVDAENLSRDYYQEFANRCVLIEATIGARNFVTPDVVVSETLWVESAESLERRKQIAAERADAEARQRALQREKQAKADAERLAEEMAEQKEKMRKQSAIDIGRAAGEAKYCINAMSYVDPMDRGRLSGIRYLEQTVTYANNLIGDLDDDLKGSAESQRSRAYNILSNSFNDQVLRQPGGDMQRKAGQWVNANCMKYVRQAKTRESVRNAMSR